MNILNKVKQCIATSTENIESKLYSNRLQYFFKGKCENKTIERLFRVQLGFTHGFNKIKQGLKGISNRIRG